jgi:hypothetical protein
MPNSIITFLGALVHEIAYQDKKATARRLSKIEDGVRRRRDFFSEEKEVQTDYDPLKINFNNNSSIGKLLADGKK